MQRYMEQKERIFNFSAPCTYIEHQEIRVEAGGSLFFGRDLAVEDADAPVAAEARALPAQLATPQAQELLKKAQAAGWLDEDLQPVCSQTMAALIAAYISDALAFSPRWKAFEKLWRMSNLCRIYSKAMEQKASAERMDEIVNILK